MKTLADTLGVSRSNLIDRLEHRTAARGPYRKAEDAALLPLIRTVVDERLTYGYRRVTALVNRKLRQAGQPTVNAKRVLRIMRRHTLTLERHTGLPSSRTHDGKIIVLASNLRWCSDHLELHARNGVPSDNYDERCASTRMSGRRAGGGRAEPDQSQRAD